jgi:hypothetical protein
VFVKRVCFYNANAAFCNQFVLNSKRDTIFIVLQIKSARVGSDLWADRGEWQNEIKARSCALRANIAQFPLLSIRAVRPEVGPYLGLSRLHVEHQSTIISTIFNYIPWH